MDSTAVIFILWFAITVGVIAFVARLAAEQRDDGPIVTDEGDVIHSVEDFDDEKTVEIPHETLDEIGARRMHEIAMSDRPTLDLRPGSPDVEV